MMTLMILLDSRISANLMREIRPRLVGDHMKGGGRDVATREQVHSPSKWT